MTLSAEYFSGTANKGSDVSISLFWELIRLVPSLKKASQLLPYSRRRTLSRFLREATKISWSSNKGASSINKFKNSQAFNSAMELFEQDQALLMSLIKTTEVATYNSPNSFERL